MVTRKTPITAVDLQEENSNLLSQIRELKKINLYLHNKVNKLQTKEVSLKNEIKVLKKKCNKVQPRKGFSEIAYRVIDNPIKT